MRLNKTKLLFIATLLLLAMPLIFATGNAQAAVYNSDGATQSATSGGWDLGLYCVGVPSAYTSGAALAVKRPDLPTTYAGCDSAATSGITTALNAAYPDQTSCMGAGYYWNSHHAAGTRCIPFFVTADDSSTTSGWSQSLNACLRCHSTGQYADVIATLYHIPYSGAKESYLKGGHKNMLRKVTVGKPWGLPGTDATGIYALNVNGTTSDFNWTTGQVDAGSCSDKTKTTKAACIAPATWTPNWSTMYWIYGGNGLSGTTPYTAISGGSYSCGRCHATGWTSDSSPVLTKEPEKSFSGISAATKGAAGVYLSGGVSGDTNAYSSWDQWGIQCSRCHYAIDGGHATFPSGSSKGGDVTAMCMNCHRQEAVGVPDVISGDSGAIPAGSAASKLVIGSSHGSVGFVSHSHGTQFLNSPHARMSGTWGQIGCPPVSISPAGTAGCDSSMSTYNTAFGAAATANHLISTAGGCTTCHNVHNTVIQNVVGQNTGSTVACNACHQNAADALTPQVTQISHPSGPGTPLNDPNPCATCHMPHGQHVFRINTDTNYVEFPTTAVDMAAPTAKDADGFDAVWVDMTHACGQCHQDATHQAAGVPKIDYNTLQGLAKVMHKGVNGSPVMPANAGIAVCNAVSVSKTIGSTTDSFMVGDMPMSTINGGLAGKVFVDWGDGSAMTMMAVGATTPGHTYVNNGTYKIRKTVQDGDPAVKGSGFGISCFTEKEVTVSSLAPTGFGTFTVTANACVGGAAIANVNVYLVGSASPLNHLSFHGVTGASGTVSIPAITGTMPSGSYNMTAFGPAGLVCYTDSLCTTLVNNLSTHETVPGTATVYCK